MFFEEKKKKAKRALTEFSSQRDERLPYWNIFGEIQDISDKRITLWSRRIGRPASITSPFQGQS